MLLSSFEGSEVIRLDLVRLSLPMNPRLAGLLPTHERRGMQRELERFIDEQVAESMMPGLACAAVVERELVWSYGSCWSDLERQLPMLSDSILHLASVSMTVTLTAMMRLLE